MSFLKSLRLEKKYTQQDVADYLGITRSAYTNIENQKRDPDTDTLKKLAIFFNTSIDEILEISTPNHSKGIKIPVLGKVQAGYPIEAIENIIDYEEIPEEMARNGEYFALQIKGNSMEPKFSEGDVVIVRKQSIVDNGDIAIVLVNGNEATVKKFYKKEHGITLMPTNPQYDPMIFSEQEVIDLPLVVIGKVVELRAKF